MPRPDTTFKKWTRRIIGGLLYGLLGTLIAAALGGVLVALPYYTTRDTDITWWTAPLAAMGILGGGALLVMGSRWLYRWAWDVYQKEKEDIV